MPGKQAVETLGKRDKFIQKNFKQNSFPACDGRCVQGQGTNSP